LASFAQKTSYRKQISQKQKQDIALQSLQKKQTISGLSKTHGCSRTTIYQQQNTALVAINKAFEEEDDDSILFNIPVSKSYIKQVVTSLCLICKASVRDILLFFKYVFDYSISIGFIQAILTEESKKANIINESYDLSTIKLSAADEIFHRNNPFLTVVDIPSRFCAMLIKEMKRDAVAWWCHLTGLHERGYNPTTTIIDYAKGLIKGHAEALPNTEMRHDHFHMLRDMNECVRFLKNKAKSSETFVLNLYQRVNKARRVEEKQKRADELTIALNAHDLIETASTNIALLVQWMQHDVLHLSGHNPSTREELYDFIVAEMACIGSECTDRIAVRINEIVISLRTRRNELLAVSHTLNAEFEKLSIKYNVKIEYVWQICYLTRYSINSLNYELKSSNLECIIGNHYDSLENDILDILAQTPRCSSMVENYNSRLRPYLDGRKEVTPERLGLIQFYLNHKPFLRSHHTHLKNKTPAEALTGKEHPSFLELLGYSTFKRKAV
jgi:transposase-like protein